MTATDSSAPVIEMTTIRKVYDTGKVKVEALKGVDLEIKKGEMVAIVGPSGSGKSTLLHIVGALDRPTTGTVRIDGRDIGALTDRELSGLRAHSIGFVFQRFHLIEGVSALDNVADGYVEVRGNVRPGDRVVATA